MRAFWIFKGCADFENLRISWNGHFQDAALPGLERTAGCVISQLKMVECLTEQLIAGGKVFVSSERLEIDRADRHRRPRVAARRRLDHDLRGCGVLLWRRDGDDSGNSARSYTGDSDHSPAGSQIADII